MPRKTDLKNGKSLYRIESGELIDWRSLTAEEQIAAENKMMKRTGENFSNHLAKHPERWEFYFGKKKTTA